MGKRVKTFRELFESESFNGGYYCSLWVTSTDPDGCHDGEMVMYAKTESELISMVWNALDNTISTASLEELDFDGPDDIKSILEFAEILIKISESDEGFEEGQGCESPNASLTLIEHIEDFRDLLATVTRPDPSYQVDEEDQDDDYDPDEDMEYWIGFDGEHSKIADLFVQAFQGDKYNGDMILDFFFNRNYSQYDSMVRFIKFNSTWKLFSARVQRSKIDKYIIDRINKKDDGIGFFLMFIDEPGARATLDSIDPKEYSKTIANYIASENSSFLINKLKDAAPEIWQAIKQDLGSGAEETEELAGLGF